MMEDRATAPLLFLELYSLKPAWAGLTERERTAIAQSVIANLDTLAAGGVTVLGYGRNDKETSRRAPYDFFAVYQVADLATQRVFEEQIVASGWYDLFEQVNLRGSVMHHADALLAHATDPALGSQASAEGEPAVE
jgi:hypothetical protein